MTGTKNEIEVTGGGRSAHEPTMEALLKLRQGLEDELKRNPSSTSDAAKKMEALNFQIARRRKAMAAEGQIRR